MTVYKRRGSKFYHFDFVYQGQRYKRTTKMSNQREAEKVANLFFMKLVQGELVGNTLRKIPTLRGFRDEFVAAVKADKSGKPKTVVFYEYCYDSLLAYAPLADARLSEIDEHLVDQFTVWALAKDHARKRGQPLQRGTVNRWCSTLKKALRMARRWKLIEVVPDIPRLDGERERTFVFTDELRRKYNELAPEPLNSFVQLSCENGICEGEAIALLKKDVHLQEQADEWGHYGYITIRDGKTEYRKRSLPITQRARSILQSWIERSKCDLVFTREDGLTPVSKWTLIQQQDRMRKLLDLPWDAVIHSGRHTGLTNLGMAGADAFTIKSIAGHASVTTSQKYVHPTPESVSRAFQRKAQYEEKVVTMPKRKRGQAVRAAAARKS